MNHLVTGGLGFLGSHIVENLLANTIDNIDIVDNCQSNVITESFFNQNQVTIIKQDINTFVTSKKYDHIYHCASVVGPVGVLKYSGQIGRRIIEETSNVMKLCIETGAKLLYVSTSELYGPSPKEHLAETDNKIVISDSSARQEYAVGKLLAEISGLNTSSVLDLKINIIRPFNIIGLRQSAIPGGFVLPRFINAALRNEPLTVYYDGKMVRSFTNVKDIVSGIMLIQNSDVNREVFNVGNELNKITILDLAKMVLKLSGSKSEIQFTDPVKLHGSAYKEAFDKVADSRKIRVDLGWYPKFSIQETVIECLEYERKKFLNAK